MPDKIKIYQVTSKIGRTVLFYAFTNKWEKINKIVIEFNGLKEATEDITSEKLKVNLKTYFEKTVAQNAEIEILQSASDKWSVLEVQGK